LPTAQQFELLVQVTPTSWSVGEVLTLALLTTDHRVPFHRSVSVRSVLLPPPSFTLPTAQHSEDDKQEMPVTPAPPSEPSAVVVVAHLVPFQ